MTTIRSPLYAEPSAVRQPGATLGVRQKHYRAAVERNQPIQFSAAQPRSAKAMCHAGCQPLGCLAGDDVIASEVGVTVAVPAWKVPEDAV